MDQSPTTDDARHAPDSGRVAVPEIAELLHIQRPAAAISAAVVVLLGLVVALVAPDVLPANPLTGLGVGIVALLAAVVAAVVLDGRDPAVQSGNESVDGLGRNVISIVSSSTSSSNCSPTISRISSDPTISSWNTHETSVSPTMGSSASPPR